MKANYNVVPAGARCTGLEPTDTLGDVPAWMDWSPPQATRTRIMTRHARPVMVVEGIGMVILWSGMVPEWADALRP
jgi:hypothetical protein